VSFTLTEATTYTTMTCGECGVPFALADDYIAARRRDHKTWYCPNGHPRAWLQKNETEEAKARAATLERRLACRDEDLRAERAAHRVTERRRAAAKGQLTKTKNRISKGVCPCCNRSFVNLGRHMTGQHPDYAETSNA
jgi:hypothetical protein